MQTYDMEVEKNLIYYLKIKTLVEIIFVIIGWENYLPFLKDLK